MQIIEGKLIAKDLRFGIVVSRFNELVSKRLFEGTVDAILRHGGDEKNIKVLWVPGAWEIPLACQKLAQNDELDAIICLGAIMRGATPHFDYIATECAKGIAQASLKLDMPIAFGILTCDTLEQAFERSGGKAGNKGFDAALSAIEMANLVKTMESQ